MQARRTAQTLARGDERASTTSSRVTISGSPSGRGDEHGPLRDRGPGPGGRRAPLDRVAAAVAAGSADRFASRNDVRTSASSRAGGRARSVASVATRCWTSVRACFEVDDRGEIAQRSLRAGREGAPP